MPPLSISAAQARRFLVRRQLLDPPRALPADPASVLQVVERLGALQFDPLEVPGARSHDLLLHARIAGYQRQWCERWLYAPRGERRLFEAYNKSLNILPLGELPYYRVTWDWASARYEERIFQRHATTTAEILARLAGEGPLSTATFVRGRDARVDWHWAPTSEGRAVLEALFEAGRVAIARREGNRRFYDLPERLFPDELLARRPSAGEAARHRLLSRYRAVGLLGPGAGAEVFTATGLAPERAALVAALVDDGTLVPAEVEGLRGPRYLLREDLPLLAACARAPRRPAPGVSFIPPLDPLLWDRRLLRAAFGFHYKWEVYTPIEQRRHGYYVLPMLFGDRLVGRIEPRLGRATGSLRTVGLLFEPGFAPLEAPGFVPAFASVGFTDSSPTTADSKSAFASASE